MRHSSGFVDDTRLQSPVGTTPEQRRRAALACAARLPRADLRLVLGMLGLIPQEKA